MSLPRGNRQSLKNEKPDFSPVEVLKLAFGPEKVLSFGYCGPEKLNWPAR